MKTYKSLFVSVFVLSIAFLIISAPARGSEMQPLTEESMRSISGKEGLQLRLNLELGESGNSSGENLNVNINDESGFNGGGDGNLALEGLWLTLDVGATNPGDYIQLDFYDENDGTTEVPVIQLSGDNITFAGIEGALDEASLKYNNTGSGGQTVAGLDIGDGGNIYVPSACCPTEDPGTLDFDGELQIWGFETL